jgi:hypothetical protein
VSRKKNFSYFIIKPDGVRFFDRIYDKLSEEFDVTRYFYIGDYRALTEFVYRKHYQTKGEGFRKGYSSYLDSVTSLFGNHAILAMVSSFADTEDFESFKKRVFDTKQQLRSELIDPNVAVVSNTPSSELTNRIKVVDEEGHDVFQRTFTKPGHYRINKFDVIHSPDLEAESTKEEIRLLIASGVLTFRNIIDKKSLAEIRRFKTLEGFDNSRAVEEESKNRFPEDEAK